jgi:hypothetical protein
MQFKNVSTYLSELDGIDTISGGVGVYGSAAAYALVWELGSLRLKHPGPKTLWSINRNDKIAILTKQAPRGYVGILSDQFWPIIEEELSKVSFSGSNIRLKLEVAMDNASQRIAKLVADKAPVDSGDLRSQIMAVDSDEASFLSQANSIESTGTLIL